MQLQVLRLWVQWPKPEQKPTARQIMPWAVKAAKAAKVVKAARDVIPVPLKAATRVPPKILVQQKAVKAVVAAILAEALLKYTSKPFEEIQLRFF